MPRFFFHVRDGKDMPDEVGMELVDLRQARIEAVKMTGQLLHSEAADFWDGEAWHMDVTDDRGLIYFMLDFMATNAPIVTEGPWGKPKPPA